MPDEPKKRPNPREEDIMAGDRRLSRPDSALPDWHIPDAAYRPIPIAWFAGAFLVQMVALFAVFIALSAFNGWFTIALSGLITGAIGMWTWDRGMQDANRGWKIATIIVLLIQLLFVSFGAGERL
ncbi:MAG: hypothetical protein ABJP48_02185 [Erythrobacter sp.]